MVSKDARIPPGRGLIKPPRQLCSLKRKAIEKSCHAIAQVPSTPESPRVEIAVYLRKKYKTRIHSSSRICTSPFNGNHQMSLLGVSASGSGGVYLWSGLSASGLGVCTMHPFHNTTYPLHHTPYHTPFHQVSRQEVTCGQTDRCKTLPGPKLRLRR